MKSLTDAIGCWTTSPDGLSALKYDISASVKMAMQATLRDDTRRLLHELELLEERIDIMRIAAAKATARCREIIATGECAP